MGLSAVARKGVFILHKIKPANVFDSISAFHSQALEKLAFRLNNGALVSLDEILGNSRGRFLVRLGTMFFSVFEEQKVSIQLPLRLFFTSSLKQNFQPCLFFVIVLQQFLSEVCESLLILDRYLYISEAGFPRVSIVPVFNPYLSPRNLAIIAQSC